MSKTTKAKAKSPTVKCSICSSPTDKPNKQMICERPECRRGRNGLSTDDFKALANKQNGRCPISGIKFFENEDGEFLDPTTAPLKSNEKNGDSYEVEVKRAGVMLKEKRYVIEYVDSETKNRYDVGRMKRVAVDHAHNKDDGQTQQDKKADPDIVRGLLIEKANWLVDEFQKGSYGNLKAPETIKQYLDNPPAKQLNLVRTFNSEHRSTIRKVNRKPLIKDAESHT